MFTMTISFIFSCNNKCNNLTLRINAKITKVIPALSFRDPCFVLAIVASSANRDVNIS